MGLTQIKAEWHRLEAVLMHKPSLEVFVGLLEPYSFLYERAFSYEKARIEHEKIRNMLEDLGVTVHLLNDAITQRASRDAGFKSELINMALEYIQFIGRTQSLANEYRDRLRANLDLYGLEQWLGISMLSPAVDTSVLTHPRVILNNPLANLFYLRDQQAITDKGVVIGRPARGLRQREPMLTRLVLKALDAKICYSVEEPGTFEGGDFIPLGNFALIGCGDRTNINGALQVMRSAVGVSEVGIVHNPIHPLIGKRDSMVTMHLDTYFNVAAQNVAVGHPQLLKRARVDIYQRKAGKFSQVTTAKRTNLWNYLKDKGFQIIELTTLEQLAYASNFLCIDNGKILAIDVRKIAPFVLKNLAQKADKDAKYRKLYDQAKSDWDRLKLSGEFFPHKRKMYKLDVQFEHISALALTGGYGGLHCLTCTLRREKEH